MELSYRNLLQTGYFINNTWQHTADRFAVTNPATGETLALVSNCIAAEATAAVEAADQAFPAWAATTAKERHDLLLQWYRLIVQHTDDLALLLTSEQGKPLAEAKGEVSYGASFIEWFAEEGRRTYGETVPQPVSSKRLFTLKQPIGVVAAITPWNFPIAMITRKIAPALAAGCTVVLKPAEDTPLCALALAQLALEAGLPAGVLNVIPSERAAETGKVLTTHPLVKKISFTGSTEVGRLLAAQASSTVKKLSLELGGNAPCIVFDDADLDEAVAGTIATKYRNAGQTCVCANRIYVQRSIYPAFMEKFIPAVQALQTGNGLTEGVAIGPLINTDAIEKVERLVSDALAKGAEVVTGGQRHNAGELFYQPTILAGCTPEMNMSEEELFGPVSAIYLFDDEAEAIYQANHTQYGLAAYFFSQNVKRCWRVAEQLDYGIVGVNEGLISYAEAPFGGVKQSGYGREGARQGIEDYLVTKYVCLGGIA
jgi:succinate-semialdehyde dehydrogenase/glutarate-semialdehyde dehydrogenase